jgi:hypothetical protein
MDDTPDPTSPADPNDTGTGIGSDVKSGPGESGGPGNEDNASGEARDAVGGTAPLSDDPTP